MGKPVYRCPHCGVANPAWVDVWEEDLGPDATTVWILKQCPVCLKYILFEFGIAALREGASVDAVSRSYPEVASIDSRVPDWPRKLLNDAQETVGNAAPSIMASASAVDAMLQIQGYKEGSLNSRIDQAAGDKLITDGMKEWAHKVRLDANAQRHADEDAAFPTMEEAERTLEMAKMLAHFLFVLPEMVRAGQEKAAGVEGQMEPVQGQGRGSDHPNDNP